MQKQNKEKVSSIVEKPKIFNTAKKVAVTAAKSTRRALIILDYDDTLLRKYTNYITFLYFRYSIVKII